MKNYKLLRFQQLDNPDLRLRILTELKYQEEQYERRVKFGTIIKLNHL